MYLIINYIKNGKYWKYDCYLTENQNDYIWACCYTFFSIDENTYFINKTVEHFLKDITCT